MSALLLLLVGCGVPRDALCVPWKDSTHSMKLSRFGVLMTLVILSACSPESVVPEADTPSQVATGSEIPAVDHKASSLAWLASRQHANGLVESAEGTGFVSLYDNALAAMVYLQSGETARARQILEYFKGRQAAEFNQSGGGFYQFRDAGGNNRSRIWLGDNAWLLIALRHYRAATDDLRYRGLEASLESWIRSLQQEDGSLKSGTNEDGTEIPLVTEGMITAYAAVSGQDAFHEGILEFLTAERWSEGESLLLAQETGGTYAYSLDLHSLPALIWEDAPHAYLEHAQRFYTVQHHELNGKTVGGYCFDEDRDVVWLEGSAQMALAYRRSGDLQAYQQTLEALEQSFIAAGNPNSPGALPYTTNPGSSFGAAPLWPEAHRQAAVSATAKKRVF